MMIRRWKCGTCSRILEASVEQLHDVFRAHAERCPGKPRFLGVIRASEPTPIGELVTDLAPDRDFHVMVRCSLHWPPSRECPSCTAFVPESVETAARECLAKKGRRS